MNYSTFSNDSTKNFSNLTVVSYTGFGHYTRKCKDLSFNRICKIKREVLNNSCVIKSDDLKSQKYKDLYKNTPNKIIGQLKKARFPRTVNKAVDNSKTSPMKKSKTKSRNVKSRESDLKSQETEFLKLFLFDLRVHNYSPMEILK